MFTRFDDMRAEFEQALLRALDYVYISDLPRHRRYPPEAEVSKYSTDFDESQDFQTPSSVTTRISFKKLRDAVMFPG